MKIYLPELNIKDKILKIIFAKYTKKVYERGFKDSYNWYHGKSGEK